MIPKSPCKLTGSQSFGDAMAAELKESANHILLMRAGLGYRSARKQLGEARHS